MHAKIMLGHQHGRVHFMGLIEAGTKRIIRAARRPGFQGEVDVIFMERKDVTEEEAVESFETVLGQHGSFMEEIAVDRCEPDATGKVLMVDRPKQVDA
jgi:hypothetical protein